MPLLERRKIEQAIMCRPRTDLEHAGIGGHASMTNVVENVEDSGMHADALLPKTRVTMQHLVNGHEFIDHIVEVMPLRQAPRMKTHGRPFVGIG
jgi:hypothetical protein